APGEHLTLERHAGLLEKVEGHGSSCGTYRVRCKSGAASAGPRPRRGCMAKRHRASMRRDLSAPCARAMAAHRGGSDRSRDLLLRGEELRIQGFGMVFANRLLCLREDVVLLLARVLDHLVDQPLEQVAARGRCDGELVDVGDQLLQLAGLGVMMIG